MKVNILHLNAGNETGGGMYHITYLLEQLTKDRVFNVTLGLFEKRDLYTLANEKNIKTVYFPNRAKYSPFLLNHLRQFIRKEEISIIHTHGPRANAYINAIRKKTPFHWITTVHSDPKFDFKEKGLLGRLMYKIHINAIKNADHIITVCDAFRPTLRREAVDDEKVTTILNGLTFAKKEAKACRSKFGFCDEVFLCVQVARLEPVKGHHITLHAFAKLKEKVKNSHLLIIGDGSLKKELQELAKQLKIENNVTFYGERRDVEHFYDIADVTLLSSLSEGFPLVLLESARAKTPIISTDVGGVHNLILDKHLGWRIEPNCATQMLTALIDAYTSKKNNKLHTIGKNLYKHASDKFSVEKFAKNVYNIYLGIDFNN